jgi:hypothetical protein
VPIAAVPLLILLNPAGKPVVATSVVSGAPSAIAFDPSGRLVLIDPDRDGNHWTGVVHPLPDGGFLKLDLGAVSPQGTRPDPSYSRCTAEGDCDRRALPLTVPPETRSESITSIGPDTVLVSWTDRQAMQLPGFSVWRCELNAGCRAVSLVGALNVLPIQAIVVGSAAGATPALAWSETGPRDDDAGQAVCETRACDRMIVTELSRFRPNLDQDLSIAGLTYDRQGALRPVVRNPPASRCWEWCLAVPNPLRRPARYALATCDTTDCARLAVRPPWYIDKGEGRVVAAIDGHDRAVLLYNEYPGRSILVTCQARC